MLTIVELLARITYITIFISTSRSRSPNNVTIRPSKKYYAFINKYVQRSMFFPESQAQPGNVRILILEGYASINMSLLEDSLLFSIWGLAILPSLASNKPSVLASQLAGIIICLCHHVYALDTKVNFLQKNQERGIVKYSYPLFPKISKDTVI